MSESIPAWKRAIYDRKKQQQKEEELKQAEKEAYLASLPPWKRALFLKKEKEAGGVASSQQGTAKAATKPTTKQNQPATVAHAGTQNKQPTPAVANNAPAWKRKDSPIINDTAIKQQKVKTSSPVNTNNNNDKSPTWNKKIAPVVATPAETPSQTETSATVPATVNGMDGLPLWKRNLLQRQQVSVTNTTGDNKLQAVNLKVTDTPQTSVAIGSPKIHSKLSSTGARPHISSHNSTVSSSNTHDIKSMVTTDTSTSSSRPRVRSTGSFDDYDDARLASLPPWKRDLILRKRAAAAKGKEQPTTEAVEPVRVVKLTRTESMDKKDSGWKKAIKKPSEHVTSSASPVIKRISDDKISMWGKRADADQVKLVRRRSSQEIDPIKSEDSDSQPVQQKAPAQEEIHPVEKEEKNESAPPILKDKDPWAHLSENDPQFKALPLWRQAMILRRRGDIRRRSNPELYMDSSTAAETTAEDEPDFADAPAWKRETLLKKQDEKAIEDEAIPGLDDPDMPEWKKEKLRKNFQEKKKTQSHSLPVLVKKKQISSYQSDASIPEWKKEAMREKQSLKSSDETDNNIPEWKKEAMREKQSLKSGDDDIPEWKKEAMKKKQTVEKNDTNIPEWKKEAMKKKQTVEKNNTNIPEWKKEAVNEKKYEEKKDNSAPLLTSIRPPSPDKAPLLTSIRPLSPDKGGPSSSPVKQYSPQPVDETDYHSSNHINDDDDIPCTNIDDLSDSDESVGGSCSYDVNPESTSTHVESASSGYSSDNNNTHGLRSHKSSKSILINRKISNPVSAYL